jgi:hypothetical protein
MLRAMRYLRGPFGFKESPRSPDMTLPPDFLEKDSEKCQALSQVIDFKTFTSPKICQKLVHVVRQIVSKPGILKLDMRYSAYGT